MRLYDQDGTVGEGFVSGSPCSNSAACATGKRNVYREFMTAFSGKPQRRLYQHAYQAFGALDFLMNESWLNAQSFAAPLLGRHRDG
jgi:hypothetical protein